MLKHAPFAPPPLTFCLYLQKLYVCLMESPPWGGGKAIILSLSSNEKAKMVDIINFLACEARHLFPYLSNPLPLSSIPLCTERERERRKDRFGIRSFFSPSLSLSLLYLSTYYYFLHHLTPHHFFHFSSIFSSAPLLSLFSLSSLHHLHLIYGVCVCVVRFCGNCMLFPPPSCTSRGTEKKPSPFPCPGIQAGPGLGGRIHLFFFNK